jgi:hypothetical protein
MTKHPSEAVLALYAGGDLGSWRRWGVARHVAACAECRRETSDFSALRENVSAMTDLPDLSWAKMSAEMKANIRLGLEAGECVSIPAPVARGIFSVKALAVCGSLALLLMAFLLERPTPRVEEMKAPEAAAFLESSGSGIQVRAGNQAMMLLNTSARDAQDVNYLASGNTMRARYVDNETGYVTINNVYTQ